MEKKRCEWTKCSERLPEHGADVLLLCDWNTDELTESYMGIEPKEWIEEEGQTPTCTAFRKREYAGDKGGGYRRAEKAGQGRLF